VAERVLEEIRERGALGSRDFGGKADPLPHRLWTMWSWKPAKQMLDALFAAGELVIAGRDSGFQRLYDLPVRVLSREVLNAPSRPSRNRSGSSSCVLSEPAARSRSMRSPSTGDRSGGCDEAQRASGHTWILSSPMGRWSGAVEDGGAPVVFEAGVELDRPQPTTAVLLSPFDLLWETRFGQRVLGFKHVIEMYKPAP
jgi:uncharacterized protein YcaQ